MIICTKTTEMYSYTKICSTFFYTQYNLYYISKKS